MIRNAVHCLFLALKGIKKVLKLLQFQNYNVCKNSLREVYRIQATFGSTSCTAYVNENLTLS